LRSGTEGCADGREDDEMSVSTSAASFPISTEGSCETDDIISDCPVGEEGKKAPEKKKGVDRSKGLKNAKGNRPGKKERERYQIFVEEVLGKVRLDPSFSLDSDKMLGKLPPFIQDNEELYAKLDKRVKAARPAVC